MPSSANWGRVKPAAPNARAAAEDLEQIVLACGQIHAQAPAWKDEVPQPTARDRPVVSWLLIGEDIALPLTACGYHAGAFSPLPP